MYLASLDVFFVGCFFAEDFGFCQISCYFDRNLTWPMNTWKHHAPWEFAFWCQKTHSHSFWLKIGSFQKAWLSEREKLFLLVEKSFVMRKTGRWSDAACKNTCTTFYFLFVSVYSLEWLFWGQGCSLSCSRRGFAVVAPWAMGCRSWAGEEGGETISASAAALANSSWIMQF